jgi:hypothetical protein
MMKLLTINLFLFGIWFQVSACPDSLQQAFLKHLTQKEMWIERLEFTGDKMLDTCNLWKLEHAFSLSKMNLNQQADSVYQSCTKLAEFNKHRIYTAFKSRNITWLNAQTDLPSKATYCLKLLNKQVDSLFDDQAYHRLNNRYIEWKEVDRKSAFLAGVLSVVPGLGKAYAGYRRQAIMSLIVNAGLGAILIETIVQRGSTDALFYAVTGLAGTFWAGSIYGTVASLQKEKQDRLNALYIEISDRFLADFAHYPLQGNIAN